MGQGPPNIVTDGFMKEEVNHGFLAMRAADTDKWSIL
jgi:hypothetical protein